MEMSGKISQIEVTKCSLFYCSQTTWCSPERAHTYTHLHPLRCLETSEGVVWIIFSFFYNVLPKFQVSLVSPDCSIEAYRLKCTTSPNKVTLLVSWHPFCHMFPAPALLTQPTSNNSCYAEGQRQEFAERANRTLTCRCKPLQKNI
jgi:hypothetical protein